MIKVNPLKTILIVKTTYLDSKSKALICQNNIFIQLIYHKIIMFGPFVLKHIFL